MCTFDPQQYAIDGFSPVQYHIEGDSTRRRFVYIDPTSQHVVHYFALKFRYMDIPEVAELEAVWTRQRGKGIGSIMLMFVEEMCRQRGVETILTHPSPLKHDPEEFTLDNPNAFQYFNPQKLEGKEQRTYLDERRINERMLLNWYYRYGYRRLDAEQRDILGGISWYKMIDRNTMVKTNWYKKLIGQP